MGACGAATGLVIETLGFSHGALQGLRLRWDRLFRKSGAEKITVEFRQRLPEVKGDCSHAHIELGSTDWSTDRTMVVAIAPERAPPQRVEC